MTLLEALTKLRWRMSRLAKAGLLTDKIIQRNKIREEIGRGLLEG